MIVRVVGQGVLEDGIGDKRCWKWDVGFWMWEFGIKKLTPCPLSLKEREGVGFGMIEEVLFWGVMVGAVLFAVAAADMIGEVIAGFGVDVTGELAALAT
jgi:hypothetical protein